MNVLHISTTDGRGGASRAARRLHDGLIREGIGSRMAVGELTGGGIDAITLSRAAGRARAAGMLPTERILIKASRLVGDVCFPHPSSWGLRHGPVFDAADVLQLHNLHGNYLDLRVLPHWTRERPVVWTLHDMWAFSGHCAYSYDCERWRTGCGPCPLFTPGGKRIDDIPQPAWDNSGAGWRRKRRLYQRAALTVVAPSSWLLDLARESVLAANPATRFHVVPYGLDTDVFRPIPRREARRRLGLDPDAEVLMFTAASLAQGRKGLAHLLDALRRSSLAERGVHLLTFGVGEDLARELPRVRALGRVTEEGLQAHAYAAADVTIVPSLADNQPLVALESMSCGTPVVASAVGGLQEVVVDSETGICVPPADPAALEAAILRVLEDGDLRARLSVAARDRALARHALATQARAYADIYASELRR